MTAILERSGPARAAGWAQTARLVERAQEGDREAFGILIEQFQRTVHAICLQRLGNHAEAAELTQDVFLHVMERLGQLREPDRFAGWLRQVAARMAINRATRRVPPATLEDAVLEGVTAQRDDPHEALVRRERADKLYNALGRLKPLDRETLIAFYIHGKSLLEMAEDHEAPLGTIKRRLHTARHRLKTELEGVVADAREWTDGIFDDDDDDDDDDDQADAEWE